MKNMIVLLGLLLCLCVSSWGSCSSGTLTARWYCKYSNICSSSEPANDCDYSLSQCNNGHQFCVQTSDVICANCNSGTEGFCNVIICTTQDEADSVAISQKCTTGVMAKDTVNGNIFDVCKNGEGLLISFNNPITGMHNSSIGYYIVTDDSADLLDEATYNHLAALACTEVSLYRGVLNGKYVYWYSTDPEPAGVVNVVRIK